MMKSKMVVVFVDTAPEKYAIQVVGSEDGALIEAATDRIEDRLSKLDRYVVVVWQSERVLKDLGKNPFGSRRIVDLYHIAWMVAVAAPEDLDGRLESLAAWCRVGRPKQDSVEDRVRAVRECYFRVSERVRIGLAVEGAGRAVVSEIGERAMSIIGKLG